MNREIYLEDILTPGHYQEKRKRRWKF